MTHSGPDGFTPQNRATSFTYQDLGSPTESCPGAVLGQICSETIEPNATDVTLKQTTRYEYDAYGNRTKATT